LWLTQLATAVTSQFLASRVTAEKIEAAKDSNQVALIKDAHEVVDRTASSVYSLLTPIATAITGYFFVSSGSSGKAPRKINPEESRSKDINVVEEEKGSIINSPAG
jgi:hypothetical protein